MEKIQIGDYVILKGKSAKPARVIDRDNWRATIGWVVKHKAKELLFTKRVRISALELFNPIKKPNVIKRFINSVFGKKP